MWWNKKDYVDDHDNGANTKSPSTPERNKLAKKGLLSPLRRHRKTGDEQSPRLAATTSGIEVSLQQGGSGSSLLALALADHGKVHKAQFAVRDWKVMEKNKVPCRLEEPFAQRHHRVPLFGNTAPVQELSHSLLLQFNAADELECVRQEMAWLDMEIAALTADRDDVEKHSMRVNLTTNAATATTNPTTTPLHSLETHRLLLKKDLASNERAALCESRGSSLTLRVRDDASATALCSSLGTTTTTNPTNVVTTVSPARGRTAAQDVQYLCLTEKGGVFVSRDNAALTACYGNLPDRLVRRMKASGMALHELLYVVTGPYGSYYSELRSGECWWGTADNDEDFHSLCADWDVARVAFGPVKSNDDKVLLSSWVILARDGRTAWKNVPSRLDRLLEGRLGSEAAPCEVSIGYGGSYFVRFLDGTVDYCVTPPIADAIESQKLDVTGLCLHAQLPTDFIIRHR